MNKEIMEFNKTQNGIMDYATQYVKNNNIILSKNYDLPKAMSNLYLNLIQVRDRNDIPVLESCSKESIQEAIMQCINKELDVGRKQGYFIPYKDKLQFQPSYFGNVKEARTTRRISINSQVIRDGEQVDIESRIDGSLIVKHKPNFKCINNKIIGAYAVGTNIDTGRVDNSDIMSIEEIKKSWLKSTNGGKTAKEFEHEFARKTVENRLAKHYINKADDSEYIFVTDANGNEVRVTNYDDLPQVEVDYTINTDEQIQAEKQKYEPKPEDVVTADDLKLEELEPVTADIPEGAIEVSYAEYKDNKDLYTMVKDSYNPSTKTVFIIKK